MPVSIAEYLGVRTDTATSIEPVDPKSKPTRPCPFKDGSCDKLKKGLPPVCSVRRGRDMWIVCSQRLCASRKKNLSLNEHQAGVLREIAKTVYGRGVTDDEILVKGEESLFLRRGTVEERRHAYLADFILARNAPQSPTSFRAVVEMQGGGETGSTGCITRQILSWSRSKKRSNSILALPTDATLIPSNAWRRQQEQFLVKGSVAAMSGARIVFVVGALLYDYLYKRVSDKSLTDLKQNTWSLALLGVHELPPNTPRPSCAPNSVAIGLDPNRQLFTNYNSFVQVLTNQGVPTPEAFDGEFINLRNQKRTL